MTSIVRTSGSLGELAQEIVAKLKSETAIKRRIGFPFSDYHLAPRGRAGLYGALCGRTSGVSGLPGVYLPQKQLLALCEPLSELVGVLTLGGGYGLGGLSARLSLLETILEVRDHEEAHRHAGG